MAKRYENGRIVGNYEVLRFVGRRRHARYKSTYETIYRVRCTSCGEVQDLTSHDMAVKSSCSCMRSGALSQRFIDRNQRNVNCYRQIEDNNDDRLWMTPDEIYRHYNNLADKSTGVSILAELNNCKEDEIRNILMSESRKRKEAVWQTSNG